MDYHAAIYGGMTPRAPLPLRTPLYRAGARILQLQGLLQLKGL